MIHTKLLQEILLLLIGMGLFNTETKAQVASGYPKIAGYVLKWDLPEFVPFIHADKTGSKMNNFLFHHTALLQMAAIIRGADTDRFDLTPQAAVLLAISAGLSYNLKDTIGKLTLSMYKTTLA